MKELKMFDQQGNFNILLKMYIKKYAKDSNLSIHETIEMMKSSGVPIKTWCFWSFSGYDSIKRTIDMIGEMQQKFL